MKHIKIILVAVFVVVAGLYFATDVYSVFTGADQGPTITSTMDVVEVSASAPDSALLEGLTASDAQDGDLTDRIIVADISALISEDSAQITYYVFDSNDNMASYRRTVRYTDYQKPVFDVVSPLILTSVNSNELLSRIQAWDVLDGDVSGAVRVSTLKATEESDVYSVTVRVSNRLGDTARLNLPVILMEEDPQRPVIRLKKHLIYLQQGSEFDAASYVVAVSLPEGPVTNVSISIENPVNTAEPGTYWVRYSYTHEGRTGFDYLTVVVQ